MKRAANRSALILLIVACAKPAPQVREVHRVVSLAPNVTEMLYAIGCGAKVAGTDNFSDTPAQAKGLPKVGGVEPDLEKIVALRPDVVIASASNAHPSLKSALSNAHLPLAVIKTDRLSDVATAMTTIGRATGCDPMPATQAFNRALENNRRHRADAPRILFVVYTDPLYIAGRETFIDDLFELTGAKNAADVKGWPQVSLEALVAHPPDILLYPDHSVTREAIAALLGRAHLPVEAIAVDENLFTRPGPRLAQAAAELDRICDAWRRGSTR